MNGRDLLEGMGYVEDRFVAEAESAQLQIQKNTRQWKNLAAMAACLCLIIGCLWMLPRSSNSETAAIPDFSGQANEGALETNAASAVEHENGDTKEETDTAACDTTPIIWNQGAEEPRSDMEYVIPEDAVQKPYGNAEAFAALGGVFLPDEVLDLELREPTDRLIWEYPDGTPVDYLLNAHFNYGEELFLIAAPTDWTELPEERTGLYLGGCVVYPVGEDSFSTVGGTRVYFCEMDTIGKYFAALVVPVPGTESHVLLTLSSTTLTRAEMEQAVSEIIEFGREMP